MLTESPIMSTLASDLEGGTAAPGLQTESPAVVGAPGPLPCGMHCVRYLPVSLQLVPAGQHVCPLGQQTAPAYGQQPWPLPE